MTGFVSGWLSHIKAAMERRSAIEELSRMSDAQLRDIGVERGSIADVFDGVAEVSAERARSGRPVQGGSRAYA